LNLLSLKENNLYFSADKDEDLNTFRLNEKYLTKNQKSSSVDGLIIWLAIAKPKPKEGTNSSETINSKFKIPQILTRDYNK